MQLRSILSSSLLALAPALNTACSSTSHASIRAEPIPAEMRSEKAMMDKWVAYATPGEQHKMLGERVGRWDSVVRMWMTPDATPHESKATCEFKWVLDGHYIAEEVRGEMMGAPFQGLGMVGWDNALGEYFATWMDNMGTGLMVMRGSYDAAKQQYRTQGDMVCPMRGENVPVRMVETRNGPDQWTAEMYGPDMDGNEFKSMEIVYKRAK